MMQEFFTPSETELRAVGAALAKVCQPGSIVFLQGELGAGKTTLVRGFLQALGHLGSVKSPTYTLVEPYHLANREIFHFDLYRLDQPAAVEQIGIRDYITPTAICLIEWPECGAGYLPAADILCRIEFHALGRTVFLQATSYFGEQMLNQLVLPN